VNGSELGECFDHERLEVRDEPLRFRQQPSLADETRANALLDPLDETRVLGADLGVECEHLADPRVVGLGVDEVVEDAVG
jgi:hypothetical protein